MRKFGHFILFFILISAAPLWALQGSLGGGYSGAFSGRQVPVVYGALQDERWALTGYSGGVKSSLTYHNAYQLNLYVQKNFGDLFWGKLSGGVGFAGYYAKRSYRPYALASAENAHDYNLGPAVKVSWNVFKPLYLTVESMFGLRRWLWLMNSYQDVSSMVLEVRFP